jgi:hypothetical protein
MSSVDEASGDSALSLTPEWTTFARPQWIGPLRWWVFAVIDLWVCYSAILAIGWLAIPIVLLFLSLSVGSARTGWTEWNQHRDRARSGPTVERTP